MNEENKKREELKTKINEKPDELPLEELDKVSGGRLIDYDDVPMYCDKCGAEMIKIDGAYICPFCGK